MGFEKPRIPERILETECMHGKLDRGYNERALEYWWGRYVEG